jgi:protein-disulfide isomerase
VTLIEFIDDNGPYCKQAAADVKALIKSDPKLRVAVKDSPVLGPDSL